MNSLDPPRLALAAELLAHRTEDALEDSHRHEILSLVKDVPLCFDRTTYTPGHITGSAFVVCRETGRLLLHHHRRLDRWLQLGGHDESEFDPKKTALREAREESGLRDLEFLISGILDLDVHEIPAARGEPPHKHHDLRYALVTASPEAISRKEAESLRLEWFDFETAASLMNEAGAARVLRRLKRLL